MEIKQLRIEAAQAGIPLTTILSKAKIDRKNYYLWSLGDSVPSEESITKLEKSIKAAKKIRSAMNEIAEAS